MSCQVVPSCRPAQGRPPGASCAPVGRGAPSGSDGSVPVPLRWRSPRPRRPCPAAPSRASSRPGRRPGRRPRHVPASAEGSPMTSAAFGRRSLSPASPSATDSSGSAGPPLRAWQRRALVEYLRRAPRDFLAVATPGAGKTTFALRVAAELLADRTVEALTVVTPTEHLKHQWAAAASSVGIALDPEFRNAAGATSSDYAGIAITYAGVAAHPMLHRNRTEGRPTLVIPHGG